MTQDKSRGMVTTQLPPPGNKQGLGGGKSCWKYIGRGFTFLGAKASPWFKFSHHLESYLAEICPQVFLPLFGPAPLAGVKQECGFHRTHPAGPADVRVTYATRASREKSLPSTSELQALLPSAAIKIWLFIFNVPINRPLG